MFKILILAFGSLALVAAQDYDYFFEYVDAPADQQQAAPPPPPPPVQQSASRGRATSQQPRARPQQSRPATQQAARPEFASLSDPTTTPVPILIDSRRIDTKTGAFVYQYAGADGSEKHEYRYPNGTVVGNYTFINDLGEKETRHYAAGVHDPSHIDETTDPNYVDLGNYELYKHLEQPYVHNDGGSSQDDFRQEPARPRTQSRPAARPAQPRQSGRPAARPAPPKQLPEAAVFQDDPFAPVPLDFDDAAAHFDQLPQSVPVFDNEDVAHVSPVAPPPPPAPLPQGPPFRGTPIRGRPVSSRGQAAPKPRHRLDFSAQQSPVSELDSIIRQFQ